MFRKIIRKNVVAMMLPIMVTLILAFYISIQLTLLDKYRCFEIDDFRNIEIIYKDGEHNISFHTVDDLYYSGFDYVSGNEKLGEFYLLQNEKSYRVFIFSNKTVERLKSGEKDIPICARLRNDNLISDYIEKEYSDSLGLGSDVFAETVKPVIISEVDYPSRNVLIIEWMRRISVVLFVVSILYTLAALIFPEIGFGYSAKGIAKSRRELLDILDEELSGDIIQEDRNMIITNGFVLEVYISHVNIEKNTSED